MDGRVVPPKHRVAGGEELELDEDTLPRSTEHYAAQDVPFVVVHEDEDLVVIDKPAGVVVHPGAGRRDATLVNGLVRFRPELASLPRAGLVHRLDKDTSGLLMVAANAISRERLVRALAAHEVRRRYRAVTEGRLTGGRDVAAPIGRDPRNRLRQRVTDTGRSALTHIRVLDRFRAHTLIEATLATGRTHQIRVHASAIGHPLVGDRRYGARGRLPRHPSGALVAVIRDFGRQALHAAELTLTHPRTGEMCSFSSSDPPDFARLLAALAADRDGAVE